MSEMRRGFKCKKDVLKELQKGYDEIVVMQYHGDFLEALKNFDLLAENSLRGILIGYYPNQRSRDQAWKTCKGSLYEYAVFRYIQSLIENDNQLKEKIMILMGDEALISYGEQVVIRNWNDIFPDVDMLIVDRETGSVIAILSCKTSLRERLTETAFWKRELERTRDMSDIKLVFITTDKDSELKTETNRYILLHVIDYTFITDPNKYHELVESYRRKYGMRDDFDELLMRVKPIDEMEDFINHLITETKQK